MILFANIMILLGYVVVIFSTTILVFYLIFLYFEYKEKIKALITLFIITTAIITLGVLPRVSVDQRMVIEKPISYNIVAKIAKRKIWNNNNFFPWKDQKKKKVRGKKTQYLFSRKQLLA